MTDQCGLIMMRGATECRSSDSSDHVLWLWGRIKLRAENKGILERSFISNLLNGFFIDFFIQIFELSHIHGSKKK